MMWEESAKRYSVSYSEAHRLWLVFDWRAGNYCDHSDTRAGAQAMADRKLSKNTLDSAASSS